MEIPVPEGFDFTHKRNALGIAIEEDRLTVLQALISGKEVSVTAAEDERLEQGIVREGRVLNQQAFVEAFKQIKKRAKINAVVASINIPSHFVTLKEFDVPDGYFSDQENLQWEMSQHINASLDTMKVMAVDVGAGKIGHKNIAVASRKGFIEERSKLLTALGLSPCAVEPDIVSVFNALSVIFLDFPAEKFLIVDISAPFTSFGMAIKGVFVPGGYFNTPKEVLTGEDGAFQLAQKLTQTFNKHFAVHGFILGKKSPDIMLACGRYAEAYLVSQTGNYMNLHVFESDPFKSSWVDVSKLKTSIPWQRLIKPFGMAMRSPYD